MLEKVLQPSDGHPPLNPCHCRAAAAFFFFFLPFEWLIRGYSWCSIYWHLQRGKRIKCGKCFFVFIRKFLKIWTAGRTGQIRENPREARGLTGTSRTCTEDFYSFFSENGALRVNQNRRLYELKVAIKLLNTAEELQIQGTVLCRHLSHYTLGWFLPSCFLCGNVGNLRCCKTLGLVTKVALLLKQNVQWKQTWISE